MAVICDDCGDEITRQQNRHGREVHPRRLRALREERAGEECGASCERYVVKVSGAPGTLSEGITQARCTLPRGHEGKHRGTLGEWEWT